MRTLFGDGVTLEPQTTAHARELYAVLSDPELFTLTDDKEPASEQALMERLARLESRQSPDGTQQWLNWVVRNAEGAVAGYVQATVHPDGVAEIAYVLGKLYWRRGYATAACGAMLQELSTTYGVRRAVATLDPANAASLALLTKLGFAFVSEDLAVGEVTFARDIDPVEGRKL